MTDAAYPDLSQEMALDAAQMHHQRVEAARRRVRATMPPIPEMRFEQAYLRSLMPALQSDTAGGDVKSDIAGGKEVAVVWNKAAWITVRDQVISPFLQGAFWGILSLISGSVTGALRASWSASAKHDIQRVVGSGDSTSLRKSAAGGVETAAVLH
ncbi:hypothetical protein CcaverHIS002_0507550 [Cutaneotrichosporon cavernicola]|uniref:Uncharacterized protein n=1 Tax=Cutaneotrichosporon cavernicola TaxID=279322 RepID=A0AA48QXB1_9TREE|nr:uncharacterized protein CcaverHIS019_0508110 [Cutaneotrichosporon cavernicola]BEI85354.1 hypothetical protein CcaverHIS002_0507550 [Cutaneotrichosporon cavernicola]BEI93183.1 hypothetical protein CcaverHIS019_0508110 [Cutaneotrichosporon cavernicola]BEJ00960.1 hypothetical protein CcaverHIS631_0508170 [Cutaneotrichosporon cavernicola]BEJ08725.1 hypothetical protein CcaverHIS641_0508190 [Cutaneotrichosporon cavernicola]